MQEKKRKTDFQDGHQKDHLGFPIKTILAVFELQVTPMLSIKFRVNWPRGAGGPHSSIKIPRYGCSSSAFNTRVSELADPDLRTNSLRLLCRLRLHFSVRNCVICTALLVWDFKVRIVRGSICLNSKGLHVGLSDRGS